MKLACILAFTTALSAGAAELASYDSAGGILTVIDQGAELPLAGGIYAEFTGGLRAPVQPHDQRSPITREGLQLNWSGTANFPNSASAKFTAAWTESAAGVALKATVSHAMPLDLESLDYEFTLPRDVFVGAKINETEATFPSAKPGAPVFFRQTLDQLRLRTADGQWDVILKLDQARAITITDIWDNRGRAYRVRIALHEGLWMPGAAVDFGLSIKAVAHPQPKPAHLIVDPAVTLGAFDGFGGNYCFDTQTPVADYTLQALHPAWARLEFKAREWEREQAAPGPQLVRDFELMQRVQRTGVPWILSLWRLPERYYADPNLKPMGSFGRQIAPDRWPEFLDLLASYLAYLKKNYGSEPTYFSFNEPDLGVDIGFTGETYRAAVRRIGQRLGEAGLKTKILLGDTANPRSTHNFVLSAASDPEAMKYVGAISFHSWGNGTAEQYRDWASVAAWLQLPLVIGEAGVDPGSYRNHMFDSYGYGLHEARQFQDLLREAHPVALIFWEYTEDYGLVRRKPDGSLEPTGRYWLMKQFADLSPAKSQIVQSSSDQTDVAISAFVRDGAMTVHILNTGPERDVSIQGLPAGQWRLVSTVEEVGLRESSPVSLTSRLRLPARSLTSLVLRP